MIDGQQDQILVPVKYISDIYIKRNHNLTISTWCLNIGGSQLLSPYKLSIGDTLLIPRYARNALCWRVLLFW